MPIEQARIPIADYDELTVKNGEALIDVAHILYYGDQTDFDFPGYVSSFFRVWQSDDIDAKMIKELTTQITRSGNVQVFNCSSADMTFPNNNKYWYEIGYVRSGGYEVSLRQGSLFVIK